MIAEGTVVNGVIVLDGGVKFPEGARVRVDLADPDVIAPPPEPYDRAKELALLREALEDVRAGRGVAVEEFMAQLAAEYKLPPVPSE
ncbi:MAG TPA: hypothetical protein VKA46_24910 [Gemmataceae bacterium]|nr:hypothetical protein [Gemmataceae bacterium]